MNLSAQPSFEIITDATPACEHTGNQASYEFAKRFIELQYQNIYGADIECGFEKLMLVSDKDNQLLSVVGIRTPDHPFFLEHYLDASAEEILSTRFKAQIRRKHLVEIGNLAGGKDYLATAYLMHELWQYLINTNFRYLLMTGTRTLLHRFRHLPLHKLAAATPHNVPAPESWGSYYRQTPFVVSGKLSDYDFRFMKPCESARYQLTLVEKHMEPVL